MSVNTKAFKSDLKDARASVKTFKSDLSDFSSRSQEFGKAAGVLAGTLTGAFATLGQKVAPSFNVLPLAFGVAISKLGAVAKTATKPITDSFSYVFGLVGQKASKAFAPVANAFTKAYAGIGKSTRAALAPVVLSLAVQYGSLASKVAGGLGKGLGFASKAFSQLGSAVGAGGKVLGSFAGVVGSTMGVLGSFGKIAGKGLVSVFQGISSFVQPAINGLMTFGTIAGVAVVGSLVALTSSSMANISATARLAKATGTSTQALSELQYAAKASGVPVEMLNHAFGDFQKRLGETRAGTGEAGTAIKMLGLDADQLAKMDPSKAFIKTAEALSKLPTAADRAALGSKLFGDSAKDLLPLLDQGEAGIARFAQEAQALGVSLKDSDASQVQKAGLALSKIGTVIEGIGNQLAIQLAPFIQAAADKFVELAKSGYSIGGTISAGIELVAKGVGVAADAVQALSIGFDAVGAYGVKGFAMLVDGLVKVGQGIESVINLIPGMKVKFTSDLAQVAKGLHDIADDKLKDLQDRLAKPPPSAGINKFFSDIKSGAEQAAKAADKTTAAIGGTVETNLKLMSDITTLSDKLKLEVSTFGKTSQEIEVSKLKEKGATDEQLKGVNALASRMKQLEKDKKQQEDTTNDRKSLLDSLKTTQEKYKEQKEQLDLYHDIGLISDKKYKIGVSKAQSEAGMDERRTPGAFEAGGKEAYSAILQSRRSSENDPTKEVAKNTRLQIMELQKANGLLSAMIKGKSNEVEVKP